MSQKSKVLDILRTRGKVDNFWCIDTRLSTRLSDIIFKLERAGLIEVDKEKSGYLPNSKNWQYVVKPITPKSVTIYYHPETHEEITRKVIY